MPATVNVLPPVPPMISESKSFATKLIMAGAQPGDGGRGDRGHSGDWISRIVDGRRRHARRVGDRDRAHDRLDAAGVTDRDGINAVLTKNVERTGCSLHIHGIGSGAAAERGRRCAQARGRIGDGERVAAGSAVNDQRVQVVLDIIDGRGRRPVTESGLMVAIRPMASAESSSVSCVRPN